jgi:hypothetical protein
MRKSKVEEWDSGRDKRREDKGRTKEEEYVEGERAKGT